MIPEPARSPESPAPPTWPEHLCGCGKPIHYTDPKVEELVVKAVELCGPLMIVDNELGESFWVPRHYIALHGLAEREVEERAKEFGWPAYLGPSQTCPRCKRTTYNPYDIREGYCGHCHDWTSPRG